MEHCLEWKSGTDAWDSTGAEILLSGTAAWDGSLEQMHGTELERKYLAGTAAWNGSLEHVHGNSGTEILCLEQLLCMFCIQIKIWSWETYLDITCDEFVYMSIQWLPF